MWTGRQSLTHSGGARWPRLGGAAAHGVWTRPRVADARQAPAAGKRPHWVKVHRAQSPCEPAAELAGVGWGSATHAGAGGPSSAPTCGLPDTEHGPGDRAPRCTECSRVPCSPSGGAGAPIGAHGVDRHGGPAGHVSSSQAPSTRPDARWAGWWDSPVTPVSHTVFAAWSVVAQTVVWCSRGCGHGTWVLRSCALCMQVFIFLMYCFKESV